MSRILVFSDVHANLTALEAVLADAGAVDENWCLGDVVGYGPDPNECITRIRDLPNLTCLMGNHDLAACGRIRLDLFNADAYQSLLWQKQHLTTDSMEFLQATPGDVQVRGEATLAHGSPRDTVWEYVLNGHTAREMLEYFSTAWCCVGHSHFQVAFTYLVKTDEMRIDLPKVGQDFPMKPQTIINPGSVGQPRDRDSRAAYAILDTENKLWQGRRVEYDIPQVQARILAAGLPARHAERLGGGW